MTESLLSTRDDIAFLRGLADRDQPNRPFYRIYCVLGLLYGLQFLFDWAWTSGWIGLPDRVVVGINLAPTAALWLMILATVVLRRHELAVRGPVGRAVEAAFMAALTAQLAAVLMLGAYAWRESNWPVWLLCLAVTFAFQGAAWLASFMVRRRGWHGLVAAGWFGLGGAMSLLVGSPNFYLVAAVGSFACMAVPGAVVLHQARRAGSLS